MRKNDAPRWSRRREARPAEIVQAALHCFAERGFAATRLEDVAARAGVTKGTIYLYFESKEGVFKAAFEQTLVPTLLDLQAEVRAAPSATAALRDLITAFPGRLTGTSAKAIPKVVLSEAGNFPDLARFYFDEVILRGIQLIHAILERGIEAGEFRSGLDSDHVAFQIFTPALMGAVWRHTIAPHDPVPNRFDLDRIASTQIDILLRGMQP